MRARSKRRKRRKSVFNFSGRARHVNALLSPLYVAWRGGGGYFRVGVVGSCAGENDWSIAIARYMLMMIMSSGARYAIDARPIAVNLFRFRSNWNWKYYTHEPLCVLCSRHVNELMISFVETMGSLFSRLCPRNANEKRIYARFCNWRGEEMWVKTSPRSLSSIRENLHRVPENVSRGHKAVFWLTMNVGVAKVLDDTHTIDGLILASLLLFNISPRCGLTLDATSTRNHFPNARVYITIKTGAEHSR